VNEPQPDRERHDPFSALRQRNFQLYAVARLCSAVAMTLLQATLIWQVYEVSNSKLQLGVLGLVQFVPSLAMSFVAGAVADSTDRRRVVMAAQAGALTAIALLGLVTLGGEPRLIVIYALVLMAGIASAFEFPARQALLPGIVTIETFPQAITTASTIQQLGFVSGPALAGGLIAIEGPALAYGAYAVLVVGSIAALAFVRPRSNDLPRKAISLTAIREGLHFVWTRQVLLGAMTLDMFAVIFGGATALLPVYANDILDVGPVGYGLLFAALDAGALVMALALVFLPPVERTGRALLLSIVVFGLATVAFGLSRSFPLSLAAYALIGAADQVSVVMRQTTIQLATPDELRGRVSSVNMLFVGASNRLGAVESGFVAAATSATFAVVSGGAGCLAVVGFVAAKMPDLRNYRIRDGVAKQVEEAVPVSVGGSQ
jgi:MFS family permease